MFQLDGAYLQRSLALQVRGYTFYCILALKRMALLPACSELMAGLKSASDPNLVPARMSFRRLCLDRANQHRPIRTLLPQTRVHMGLMRGRLL